jgi:hypothetical protein
VLCAFVFLLCAQSAQAAVVIKPINVGAPAGTSSPVSSGGAARAATPLNTGGATRIGGTPLASTGNATRAASAPRLSIGKYLGGTANALKPGSSVKVPGSTGLPGDIDMSNYATVNQIDNLQNQINNLNLDADLTNYYTIPETDNLLDEKLDKDALVAGANITITTDSQGNKIIAATGGSGNGDKGDPGNPGANGREIELRNDSAGSGYIQWHYVGNPVHPWQNLIAIADLQGPEGAAGAAGQNGNDGSDGLDGREVQMQVDNGIIQWKLAGDLLWNDLLSVSSLIPAESNPDSDGVWVQMATRTGQNVVKEWVPVL